MEPVEGHPDGVCSSIPRQINTQSGIASKAECVPMVKLLKYMNIFFIRQRSEGVLSKFFIKEQADFTG